MVQLAARHDIVADLGEVLASRQVLEELVKRDLKVRYKRSVLGLAWTMLNPLLMMAVTSVVFSSFFRFAVEDFPIYFLSAYLLWGFFSQGTVAATTSVLGGAGLARKIYLPTALFPLASVGAAGVNLLLSLPPLFLFVILTGGRLSWALLSLPLGLGLAALFTCGMALFLSATSVFFHDTIHIYQVVLQAWMYLTPIFYPADIVPPKWSAAIWINPLYHFVQLIRAPIYAGAWPDPVNVAVATAYAMGAAALGWWYFERTRHAFVSYL